MRVGLFGSNGVLGDPEADSRAQEDRARLPPHEFCREDGSESGSPETEQTAEDPRAFCCLSPRSLPGFFEGLFKAATSLGAAAVLALARRAVLAGRVLPCSPILPALHTGLGISFARRDASGLSGALWRRLPVRVWPRGGLGVSEQVPVLWVVVLPTGVEAGIEAALDEAPVVRGSFTHVPRRHGEGIGIFALGHEVALATTTVLAWSAVRHGEAGCAIRERDAI
jgi:hypothetical protein